MDTSQHYFNENKKLWNQRTLVHKDSSFYDKPSFLQGQSSLKDIEFTELGDVKGKRILHLQCHFGMDTLSLARMGARVTGVDFSEQAIEEARNLNEQLGLDADFVCCNLYDVKAYIQEQFDIVFTSYGVISWLPDLEKWAAIIAGYLKPGGFFYMAEFHPVLWMFDDDFKSIKYYYHNQEVIDIDTTGTYTDRNAPIGGKEFTWNHSTSEVLSSLLRNGLRLDFFNEYSYSPSPCFNNVVKGPDGNYRIAGLEDKLPMVFTLKATKPPLSV